MVNGHKLHAIQIKTMLNTLEREKHRVLERIARAMCAQYLGCSKTSLSVNTHWPAYLPIANAAYDELLLIDQERYQPKPKDKK